MLDVNVAFSSDMRVILHRINKKTFMNSSESTSVIGQFLVPVKSLTTLYNKPQFYNVLD